MLRNFLGNLGSGVIRLAVAVGILVAVGIFIVRPVLDTTEKVSKETRQGFEKSFNGVGDTSAAVDKVNKTVENLNKELQAQIRQSFHTAKVHGASQPQKLLRCVQRAEGDVHKITRCTAKF